MQAVNIIILGGNLAQDPETNTTPGGKTVCNFGLALNSQYRTRDGEQREEVSFVPIEVWGRQAENCGEYLSKGSPVLVEGKVKQDRWEDRETGKGRSRLKFVAHNVQFLGRPGSHDESGRADGSEEVY